MRLRLAKVDESQFLISLKKRVWGSKTTRFSDWQRGDLLLFIVDKSFAALAEVHGEPYFSNKTVWKEGLFPYRIPLKFIHSSLPHNRVVMTKNVRDLLTSIWGPNYHRGILDQLLIEDFHADTIIGEVKSSPNELAQMESDIRELINSSDSPGRITAKNEKRKKYTEKIDSIDVAVCEENCTDDDISVHINGQGVLVKLGKVIGCSVWVSSLYRDRKYSGKPLGDGCLESLSVIHMNEYLTNIISSFDVVWLYHNVPVCVFEVETAPTMCSGLLRISDLITLVPALNFGIYIVSPARRRDDLIQRISHPIFQKIGLGDICRFIPVEGIEGLLSKVNGLSGYVKTSVLDSVAEYLVDAYPGNLDV